MTLPRHTNPKTAFEVSIPPDVYPILPFLPILCQQPTKTPYYGPERRFIVYFDRLNHVIDPSISVFTSSDLFVRKPLCSILPASFPPYGGIPMERKPVNSIKMHEVPSLPTSRVNSTFGRDNGRDGNVEKLHKFVNLPSPRGSKSIGKVKCLKHRKEMAKAGTSSRGISEYFCPKGCKAEIGVGRVKRIIDEDGYGFLITLNSEEEIFFHFSNVENPESIKHGDLFTFRVAHNPHTGELQAVRLQPLHELRRVKDERR